RGDRRDLLRPPVASFSDRRRARASGLARRRRANSKQPQPKLLQLLSLIPQRGRQPVRSECRRREKHLGRLRKSQSPRQLVQKPLALAIEPVSDAQFPK